MGVGLWGKGGEEGGGVGGERVSTTQHKSTIRSALAQQQLASLLATIYGKPKKMFTLLYIVNLQQSQAESEVRLSWGGNVVDWAKSWELFSPSAVLLDAHAELVS